MREAQQLGHTEPQEVTEYAAVKCKSRAPRFQVHNEYKHSKKSRHLQCNLIMMKAHKIISAGKRTVRA
ncbi:hypothetical protein F7725_006174 [Dissostichus mawsoni]|uniref:Uncharacterized protein n=1 Tax=Dissostichus mawsoni TaxID=36200 RepID=A0A7J5YVQ5_DISMA|nr:hypothetical protein F7725_006174 [Dissostichus mawsoni]